MINKRFVVTEAQRPAIERFIRSLPGALSGRVPDPQGVGKGMRARIGMTFFSLVAPNFEELGRGRAGADGTKWAPLSAKYLAYSRPITGRKPPKGPGKAPGDKNGFLTKEELKAWRRIYAQALGWYIMRESDKDAKAHAAAVAWTVMKERGAKTKLQEFGSRKAGVDYQTLVDTGTLRRSLLPGQLQETVGPAANYQKARGQEFDDQGSRLVVGTLVPYAKYHHNAKKNARRLWPKELPPDWERQLVDQVAAGLARIGELFGGQAA